MSSKIGMRIFTRRAGIEDLMEFQGILREILDEFKDLRLTAYAQDYVVVVSGPYGRRRQLVTFPKEWLGGADQVLAVEVRPLLDALLEHVDEQVSGAVFGPAAIENSTTTE